MNPNLEVLRTEIPDHLAAQGMILFQGVREHDERPIVTWDVHREPDHTKFIAAAAAMGVKVIVYRDHEFQEFMVEAALEDLEDTDLPYDERREYERRLKDFRNYSGFTCSIELSFAHEATVYTFELRTEWYREFTDLSDEVAAIAEEGGEDPPLGGYYSAN